MLARFRPTLSERVRSNPFLFSAAAIGTGVLVVGLPMAIVGGLSLLISALAGVTLGDAILYLLCAVVGLGLLWAAGVSILDPDRLHPRY